MLRFHGSNRLWLPVLSAAAFFALPAFFAGAQEPTPYTMHVYANLLQVPVLVLSVAREPLPLIDASRFRVSLGDRRALQPTRIRLEGNDPIKLDILMDLTGPLQGLAARLPDALAALTPDQLRPEDQVSLYGVDCKLERSVLNLPAQPETLRAAARNLLNSTSLHGGKTRPACGNSVRLWDSTIAVLQQSSGGPGRHVLLVLTDGEDAGSKAEAVDVPRVAARRGIAIFGLQNYAAELPSVLGPKGLLDQVCGMSGGLALSANAKDMESSLRHFISLLRGRYIIEFPRPNGLKPGSELLHVSIDRTEALIRSAGVTMPTADPAPPAEDNAIPTQPDSPAAGEPGDPVPGAAAKQDAPTASPPKLRQP